MILLSLGLCRALSEKDYTVVGRVRFPGSGDSASGTENRIPLLIGPKDLHLIHQQVMA